MHSTPLFKLSCALLCASFFSLAQAASLETARSLYQTGKLKQALLETSQVIQSQPDSVDALFLKAQIESDSKNTQDAIESYKSVILIDPGHMESYNNLAALYAQQGKLELASQALENAIKTDPIFATVYANLRAIYIEMSKQHYRQALKLKPEQRRTQIAAIDIGGENSQILDQEILLVPESIQAAVNTSVPDVIETPGAKKPNTSQVSPQPVQVAVAPNTSAQPAPDSTAKAKPAGAPQGSAKSGEIKSGETKPKAAKAVETKKQPESWTAETSKKQAKKPAAPANPALEVKKALLNWANAWSNRNSSKYIDAYIKGYAPAGKTSKDWAAGRRWNFKTKKYIKVTLSGISIKADGNRYSAKFKQDYESNTYQDVVNKKLIFVRQAGRWKIKQEHSG